MNNYTNDNTARRYVAHVSIFGVTQVHLRNPYIIAWWSAAFPGFGHLLLSKSFRGFLFIILEVIINTQAYINMGIIYTFVGEFDLANQVLDTRWLILYLPLYFFIIWDSYRTTVDLNFYYVLADWEQHRFHTSSIGAFEIDFLDKKKPVLAAIASVFVPGLGQLYLNRLIVAFIILFFTISILYLSNFLTSLTLLFAGELQRANAVLHIDWFLFLPSIYGFSVFDAYINAVENNKLFAKEQRSFLKDNYQHPDFQILKSQKMEQ